MSRRLMQLVIPVTPERRMFRIHDPAVDPDAPGGPLPPVGSLISTNREQLWVGSLQEDIDVRLVLEEWDGAPPPCGDAWDEEAKGSIYLRGQVSVSMGLAGTAVHGLRLGGGVGDYSVRVYAGNRDIVTQRYAALFDRHRNPLGDEFQQEKRALEGLERYLVQLWRESLARPAYRGYDPQAFQARPDGARGHNYPQNEDRGRYGPPGIGPWVEGADRPVAGLVWPGAVPCERGEGALDDGAAEEFGAALMLVLPAEPALVPAAACWGLVLPVAETVETVARLWDAALGEAGVRAPCTRNGIIA